MSGIESMRGRRKGLFEARIQIGEVIMQVKKNLGKKIKYRRKASDI